MYRHINSASRIHAQLERALQQTDAAAWAVWANVFGVKGTNDQQTVELVLPQLHWLHVELQLLEEQVRVLPLSAHLYESAVTRVRQVISPLNLGSGWNGIRGSLTPDVMLALAWCNEMLPDEESAIDPADFLEIQGQVEELDTLLGRSELPERIKKLIAHQLELIRTALAQYPIAGARALREAGRSALGEIIESREDVREQPDTEAVGRLAELWKRVNTVADAALKADKLGQLGVRAWDALQGLLSGGGGNAL